MNHIYYKSTRNNDVSILASRAILKGISDDGGLYVPERVPELDFDIKDIVNMDYKEIAYKVIDRKSVV